MSESPTSRRVGAAIAVVGILAICAIPLWSARHDGEVNRKLHRDGAVVDGEVVGRRTRSGRGSLLLGRKAEVRFVTEDGETVQTMVTVDDLPDRGPTRVRYLRTDPSVARLVADPVPRRDNWKLVTGAAALGLAAAVVIKLVLKKRRGQRSNGGANGKS